jgi:hypothetical protein
LGQHLELRLDKDGVIRPARVEISQLVVAGWTGRDPVAVEAHIRELEALGVARPATVPIFYRVSAARMTTADMIEAAGPRSSGEVEFLLLQHDGRLWVGVGSDHTDRAVETYNVTVSKQMCDKPIAPTFWAFDEIASHWDQLVLRSHIVESGEKRLYQEGNVGSMRLPLELIRGFSGADSLPDGTLMFCGTLTARGGIRPASHFSFALHDPVRRKDISGAYDILDMPVLG